MTKQSDQKNAWTDISVIRPKMTETTFWRMYLMCNSTVYFGPVLLSWRLQVYDLFCSHPPGGEWDVWIRQWFYSKGFHSCQRGKNGKREHYRDLNCREMSTQVLSKEFSKLVLTFSVKNRAWPRHKFSFPRMVRPPSVRTNTIKFTI